MDTHVNRTAVRASKVKSPHDMPVQAQRGDVCSSHPFATSALEGCGCSASRFGRLTQGNLMVVLILLFLVTVAASAATVVVVVAAAAAVSSSSSSSGSSSSSSSSSGSSQ